MDKQIYWFITVFSSLEHRVFRDGDFENIPRHMRTWGFYTNKEDALSALETNRTDMWETVYDYAILEPYYEGISGYAFEEDRYWFKYNREKDSYELIEAPEGVLHYVSFALG